ncbi:MAG: EamA family transporter [Acidobacteria bacterium]|nr:EamA family transporter [Acidobacteriota bacterium]
MNSPESRVREDSTTNPTAPRRSYSGYFYIAGACLFWGLSACLGRAAFSGRLLPGSGIERVRPLILSQARSTFSFMSLFIGLVAVRGVRRLRVNRRDVGCMLLLGLVGLAASNYFYYLAVQRTSVATAITVQYTAPVWVLLYMLARRREKPTLSKAMAVMLAVIGIGFVIGLFGQGELKFDRTGIEAALFAAFSFAYYNIHGHSILERNERWTVLLYSTMFASLFWIIVNPPGAIRSANYSSMAWSFLFAFAVLSALVPFSLYFAGLERLQPSKAIVLSCLEPVFAILIAAVILKEVVRPLQAVGIAMVLVAIVLVEGPQAILRRTAAIGPVD